MMIEELIKELEAIFQDTGGNIEATIKVNNHYYDITEIYYDSYIDDIIIEHKAGWK